MALAPLVLTETESLIARLSGAACQACGRGPSDKELGAMVEFVAKKREKNLFLCGALRVEWRCPACSGVS